MGPNVPKTYMTVQNQRLLTATPLQNSLSDLHYLISFIDLNLTRAGL